MIDYNLRYLIACSGGPDSMALLDMFKDKCYIEVAHINYHKRDSAIRDQKIVEKYCNDNNIKFHLEDYKDKESGNFQNNARIFRYKFFEEVCDKNNLDAVLVAHQKDDVIETYFMQLDKKIGVNYYGLKEENTLYGVKVIRPLLDYTKDDLVKYCIAHNIEYGIDESNLTNHYERNKIRHSKINNLDSQEKNKIIQDIKDKNIKKENDLLEGLEIFKTKSSFDVDEFLSIPNLKNVLRVYFEHKSDKYFCEMLRQLKECDNCVFINNSFYLVKEYSKINYFSFKGNYEYKFNNINELINKDYDYFKIVKSGNNFNGATITESDFPIVIRNYRDGDYILMRYGRKKINRFFIDNKIKLQERISYPIVVNKDSQIILVKGIGCDINHYSKSHNLFVE